MRDKLSFLMVPFNVPYNALGNQEKKFYLGHFSAVLFFCAV